MALQLTKYINAGSNYSPKITFTKKAGDLYGKTGARLSNATTYTFILSATNAAGNQTVTMDPVTVGATVGTVTKTYKTKIDYYKESAATNLVDSAVLPDVTLTLNGCANTLSLDKTSVITYFAAYTRSDGDTWQVSGSNNLSVTVSYTHKVDSTTVTPCTVGKPVTYASNNDICAVASNNSNGIIINNPEIVETTYGYEIIEDGGADKTDTITLTYYVANTDNSGVETKTTNISVTAKPFGVYGGDNDITVNSGKSAGLTNNYTVVSQGLTINTHAWAKCDSDGNTSTTGDFTVNTNTGVVTANNDGTTDGYISCTISMGGVTWKKIFSVTVNGVITAIKLKTNHTTLNIGDQATLTAEVTGSSVSNVTCTSSNTAVMISKTTNTSGDATVAGMSAGSVTFNGSKDNEDGTTFTNNVTDNKATIVVSAITCAITVV